MQFQIIRQTVSARDVIESVHMMWALLRQQLKIQQIDRDGAAQILILLPLMQGLVHPRPIIERPLLHVVMIHQLDFDVDLTAVTYDAVYVQPRELSFIKIRIQFTVNKGDVRELILPLPTQNRVEEAQRNALALLFSKDKFEEIIV